MLWLFQFQEAKVNKHMYKQGEEGNVGYVAEPKKSRSGAI